MIMMMTASTAALLLTGKNSAQRSSFVCAVKTLGLDKNTHNIWSFASTPHLFVSMSEANCKQPTAITPSARKPADEGVEGPLGP